MAPMPRLPSTISAAWQSAACSRMDSPTPAAEGWSACGWAGRLLTRHMTMHQHAPAPRLRVLLRRARPACTELLLLQLMQTA